MARMISSCRRSMRQDTSRNSHGFKDTHAPMARSRQERLAMAAAVRATASSDKPRPSRSPRSPRRDRRTRRRSSPGPGRDPRRCDALEPVQPHAHLRQLRWEGGRMRTILVAALDRVVGNEPRVPTARTPDRRGPPSSPRSTGPGTARPRPDDRAASVRPASSERQIHDSRGQIVGC